MREAHASRKLTPVLTHCFRGSRVFMAVVAGCVTGVLGLTNTLGLLSYVLAMALVRRAPASGLGWEVACSALRQLTSAGPCSSDRGGRVPQIRWQREEVLRQLVRPLRCAECSRVQHRRFSQCPALQEILLPGRPFRRGHDVPAHLDVRTRASLHSAPRRAGEG